jgi:hypothetical protein
MKVKPYSPSDFIASIIFKSLTKRRKKPRRSLKAPKSQSESTPYIVWENIIHWIPKWFDSLVPRKIVYGCMVGRFSQVLKF